MRLAPRAGDRRTVGLDVVRRVRDTLSTFGPREILLEVFAVFLARASNQPVSRFRTKRVGQESFERVNFCA